MFEDWQTHRPEEISKALLWEYDTDAPTWDWEYMKPLVVERVIERGNISDYYALLQRYGGFGPVRDVVRRLPRLSLIDQNWVCRLFHLNKEELACYTRNQSRTERLKR